MLTIIVLVMMSMISGELGGADEVALMMDRADG